MIFHRFFLTFHDFLIEDISLFPTLHRNDYILQKRTCVIQIDDNKLSDINSELGAHCRTYYVLSRRD